MTTLTITQITEGIRDTLAPAEGLKRVESGVTLTESIPDTPLLQVYFQDEETDIASQTDRTTFRGGVKQAGVTHHADVYVRQRGNIGEDIAACEEMAEAVRTLLASQNTKPYFGLDGLKAFHWRAERVTFEYADVKYSGIRFVITTRVF